MAGSAPTRFQSAGMGDNLRARIDEKLGRGAPAQVTATQYGAVEMPDPVEQPALPTTGPGIQPMIPSPNMQKPQERPIPYRGRNNV